MTQEELRIIEAKYAEAVHLKSMAYRFDSLIRAVKKGGGELEFEIAVKGILFRDEERFDIREILTPVSDSSENIWNLKYTEPADKEIRKILADMMIEAGKKCLARKEELIAELESIKISMPTK